MTTSSSEPPRSPSLTESVNPASVGIDLLSSRAILEVLHGEDHSAWQALGDALEELGRVVESAVDAYCAGGRIIYVGAGTSGRLGVLDASECPPTFSVEPGRFVGVIAGGENALRESIEGAEDSPADGAAAMRGLELASRDLVCGIAASGSTPYVLGALEEALVIGASTALIACNRLNDSHPDWQLLSRLGHRVELLVGPEVIAGSTRLKAGTATKMALNMISTATMVRVGKVYDNLMVDLRPVNRKLRQRARKLVMRVATVGESEAAALLEKSGNDVKTAIVMGLRGGTREEAQVLLERANGQLRAVIEPE